jgi:hypothetical protein
MPQEGGYPVLAMIQEPAIGGNGSPDDPYLIESADQLLAISRDAGAHYRLTNDIDLQGRSFARPIIPIFWGRFDGHDHAVGNATFTGTEDAGLFGVLLADATVDSLTMIGVHVENTVHNAAGQMGVLAARNHGRICACCVSTDCGFGSVGTNDLIGGLVAVNGTGGEIERCFVSWAATGKYDRGGLTLWGGIAGLNLGRITECHASAFVGGGLNRCAALVGQNDGIISDCYADGYSRMAGLVYLNHNRIAHCYAAVTVPADWDAGGLVSENVGGLITGSYFLAQADGGGPDNGLGEALSEEEMPLQASFSGWDFDQIWVLRAGDGDPRLRWEEACEP